jgi:hypothetical protein
MPLVGVPHQECSEPFYTVQKMNLDLRFDCTFLTSEPLAFSATFKDCLYTSPLIGALLSEPVDQYCKTTFRNR